MFSQKSHSEGVVLMGKRKSFKGKKTLMLFNPIERSWLYDGFAFYELDKLQKEGWRIWN